MRLAERNGQRELRAARLARLRAGPCLAPASLVGTPSVPESSSPDPAAAAEASFLEVYLRGLSAPEPAPESAPEAMPEVAGAVLPFHGPEAAERSRPAAGGRPGAGAGARPRRARPARRPAPLEPEALAARLGPIGRLIPADAWIAVARAATAGADAAPAPRRAEAAAAR